jgi:hypothetical protein
MLSSGTIRTPWYDVQGRKYIDIEIQGILYTVKIPFRYNRVMCHVKGIVPIQLFEAGDRVECMIQNGVLCSIQRS